ncbi:hypothetical protein QBC44DRAFT_328075 [Cladorrhinum sp. PSN332]|nr:hypothetical protein QBC44DRAFT_328075 [Cladorrhinum sp. PSN332]
MLGVLTGKFPTAWGRLIGSSRRKRLDLQVQSHHRTSPHPRMISSWRSSDPKYAKRSLFICSRKTTHTHTHTHKDLGSIPIGAHISLSIIIIIIITMSSSFTSSSTPILVLGGTGTVGSRIASQLSSQGFTPLVASRNNNNTDKKITLPSDHVHVQFDWDDPSTWSNPFSSSSYPPPKSIYLVAPPHLDGDKPMIEFIDFARSDHDARRFVLQSASSIESGGPVMGKVHAYLRELGQRGEVDWAVLRPTWFQQNFGEQQNHTKSIKEESKIYSATSDGKIPWVSADDIAAVAVRALTSEDAPNTEYLVLGPELLSYKDIAAILSEVLGRKIVHVDMSATELQKRHREFGMPEEYARMMSAMDTSIKFGAENRTNDVIFSVTGVAPRKFSEYALSVKDDVWVGV